MPSVHQIARTKYFWGCVQIMWPKIQEEKVKENVTPWHVYAGNIGARREWVVSITSRPFYPRKWLSTHCKRDWVDIENGLGRERKSCLTGIRFADCTARSESLYPLRYTHYAITLVPVPRRNRRQEKLHGSSTLCALTKHYSTGHVVGTDI